MPQYIVQFALIREIQVESEDHIQAERDAYWTLPPKDRWETVASLVIPAGSDDDGAQPADESAWRTARDRLDSIDREWLEDAP